MRRIQIVDHQAKEGARGFEKLRWFAPVCILAFGLIFQFCWVRLDDIDGDLYTLIARNLAEDGQFFRLHALPGVYSPFFEHPPLFFSILAGVIRTAGETALPWFCALLGLLTLFVTYRLGRALLEPRAALLAVAILSLTESFFRYQARPRLDGPLTLMFTLSVALLVCAAGRTTWLAAGGLAAGLGALIKGPPALAAPIAAALILLCVKKTDDLRRPSRLLIVAGTTLALPASFLLYDHFALGGAWWDGYVGKQLIASFVGLRSDGRTEPLYLFSSLATRFWPGLPFVLIALWRPRGARLGLLLWAGLIVGGFSLAGRAYWVYNMPAFVPLALLAGAGANDLLERFDRRARAFRSIQALLLIVGLVVIAAIPSGVVRKHSPVPWFDEVRDEVLRLVPEDQPIGLLPGPDRKAAMIYLAQDTDRRVELQLEHVNAAVIHRSQWPRKGWTDVMRNRHWVLARPASDTRPPTTTP